MRSQLSCDYNVVRRFVQEPGVEVPRIPIKAFGTVQERRALDFFYHCTALDLSGAFRPDFWRLSVLQLSNHSKCLKHAVVALGAIHERFAVGDSLHNSALLVTEDRRYIFAVKQYNAAIKELRDALEAGCPAEVILLCCILFVCFESFRSGAPTAMMHLKNGIHAIQAWRAGKLYQGVKMDPTDPTTRMLLGLVSRLGPQLTNIDMSNVVDFGGTEAHIIKASGDLFRGLSQIGMLTDRTEFATFEEARDDINHIVNMELAYFFQINPLFGTKTPEEAKQLQLLIRDTMAKFEDWVYKFEALMARTKSFMSVQDERTALFLETQYKFIKILINCLFVPKTTGLNQSQTNALIESFTPQFLEVLQLIERQIAYSKEQPASSPGGELYPRLASTFYPEAGIVSPLFLLGIGARDSAIRSRAMEILRSEKRREGTWDSETCWRVIEFVQTHPKEVVEPFLRGRYRLYENFVFMGYE